MADMEGISQGESLAREFEKWQKEYYDEVHAHFANNNKARGNAAFDGWQRRFLEYLDHNLPEKVNEYNLHLKKNTGGELAMLSVLQNWQRKRGDAVESFLTQCIHDARKGRLNAHLETDAIHKANNSPSPDELPIPKIFISHSSVDTALAEMLVGLFRSALNLSAEEIRCTSVEGHQLPGGADIDESLRRDLLEALAFVGLISEASFESAYVLFELGARWGAQKSLIPLLSPGVDTSILKGPIGGFNALSCDNSAHLLQLVHDVSRATGIAMEPPHVYQKNISRIGTLALEIVSEPIPRAAQVAKLSASEAEDESFDIDKLITDDLWISFDRKNHLSINSYFLQWDECTLLLWMLVPRKGEGLRNAPNNRYLIAHQTGEEEDSRHFNAFILRYSSNNTWDMIFSNPKGELQPDINRFKLNDGLDSGWHQVLIAWDNSKPLFTFLIDVGRRGSARSRSYLSYWPREYDDSVFIGAWLSLYPESYCETKLRHLWICNKFLAPSHYLVQEHLALSES